MRYIAVIGIAAIASLPTLVTPVRAEIEYPYSGDGDGGRNCGFSTLEQCRATISGMGGSCEPNLFYPGSASDTSQRICRGAILGKSNVQSALHIWVAIAKFSPSRLGRSPGPKPVDKMDVRPAIPMIVSFRKITLIKIK